MGPGETLESTESGMIYTEQPRISTCFPSKNFTSTNNESLLRYNSGNSDFFVPSNQTLTSVCQHVLDSGTENLSQNRGNLIAADYRS
mmetsp:Transcript_17552/g.29773  ORF Transcript_17552/g.29773 Transcript_17552/m.29773 type:complete len:87 (+) Transcript_17552:1467-1727(+)